LRGVEITPYEDLYFPERGKSVAYGVLPRDGLARWLPDAQARARPWRDIKTWFDDHPRTGVVTRGIFITGSPPYEAFGGPRRIEHAEAESRAAQEAEAKRSDRCRPRDRPRDHGPEDVEGGLRDATRNPGRIDRRVDQALAQGHWCATCNAKFDDGGRIFRGSPEELRPCKGGRPGVFPTSGTGLYLQRERQSHMKIFRARAISDILALASDRRSR
jgi:hypothetical protein